MCGRYALTVSARVLAEVFELDHVPEHEPRYNIAPTQEVPIVRRGRDGGREPCPARWGLIPSWAKDAKIGARMINARSETAASKPSFRAAVKRRRCLIPADGFYEWQKVGSGKQPHFIRFADERVFALAGLWEVWRPQEDQTVTSCTILTTEPNEAVAPLHDRMPVVLSPSAYAEWLSPDQLSADRLQKLMVPCPPDEMETFPVGRGVNNPRFDDPACIARLEDQQSLW
jgi:putative SOS response-associated peptidase YedK